MVRSYRTQITFSVFGALVAVSTLAVAQAPADIECRKTETQAECHARLKCKANEELEDCQKRLRAEPKNDGNADAAKKGGAGAPDDRGREREADQESRERRDRDNPSRERGERNSRASDEDATSRGERGGRQGVHRRGASGRTKGFQANKTFGLGLELGEPAGLNGKYFVSESSALDFGIGWSYGHYYYGDGFHIYGDYLWHPISLVSAAAFELPLYIGVGLRFWDFNYCVQRVCSYGGSAVGIRVPFGIAFDFNNVPLDIFLQLVPVLDFLNGDYYNRYGNREHFGIDLSVGLRYWFK